MGSMARATLVVDAAVVAAPRGRLDSHHAPAPAAASAANATHPSVQSRADRLCGSLRSRRSCSRRSGVSLMLGNDTRAASGTGRNVLNGRKGRSSGSEGRSPSGPGERLGSIGAAGVPPASYPRLAPEVGGTLPLLCRWIGRFPSGRAGSRLPVHVDLRTQGVVKRQGPGRTPGSGPHGSSICRPRAPA